MFTHVYRKEEKHKLANNYNNNTETTGIVESLFGQDKQSSAIVSWLKKSAVIETNKHCCTHAFCRARLETN